MFPCLRRIPLQAPPPPAPATSGFFETRLTNDRLPSALRLVHRFTSVVLPALLAAPTLPKMQAMDLMMQLGLSCAHNR